MNKLPLTLSALMLCVACGGAMAETTAASTTTATKDQAKATAQEKQQAFQSMTPEEKQAKKAEMQANAKEKHATMMEKRKARRAEHQGTRTPTNSSSSTK